MADPTAEELRLLATQIEWDWEEALPPPPEGGELPIEVQASEVVALVQIALARGIEIGRQHPVEVRGG